MPSMCLELESRNQKIDRQMHRQTDAPTDTNFEIASPGGVLPTLLNFKWLGRSIVDLESGNQKVDSWTDKLTDRWMEKFDTSI